MHDSISCSHELIYYPTLIPAECYHAGESGTPTVLCRIQVWGVQMWAQYAQGVGHELLSVRA